MADGPKWAGWQHRYPHHLWSTVECWDQNAFFFHVLLHAWLEVSLIYSFASDPLDLRRFCSFLDRYDWVSQVAQQFGSFYL